MAWHGVASRDKVLVMCGAACTSLRKCVQAHIQACASLCKHIQACANPCTPVQACASASQPKYKPVHLCKPVQTPCKPAQAHANLCKLAQAQPWRHVTLSRPALSFSWGRCGRASKHKVFRSTTSFLDWPLFNTILAATNTEFPLVTSDTVRDLSQSTAQHKLHTTTPTSAGHIATVPPHCSASATTLRATHGLVGS